MKILLDDKARHLNQTGYGRVAMTVAQGLIRNGRNHVTVPYEKFDKFEVSAIENDYFNYQPDALSRLNDFDLAISVGNPASTKRLDLPSLMYTMVDTSDIPSDWVSKLSTMDGFLTPASKVTEIFKKHFSNVYEVPLYGDSTTFKPRQRWRAEGADKFSFIFTGTHCYRKGTDILVEAFIKEFDVNEAKLTLLCTEKAVDALYNFVIQTMGKHNKVSDIEIISTRLTDGWMARYYSRHDVFVTFSRGEGFGYPLYEAGLTGLPVIAPAKLPSDDFLETEYNFLCKGNSLNVSEIDSVFGQSFKKSSSGNEISIIEVPLETAQQIMRKAHLGGRDKINAMGLTNAMLLKYYSSAEKFSLSINSAITKFLEK